MAAYPQLLKMRLSLAEALDNLAPIPRTATLLTGD